MTGQWPTGIDEILAVYALDAVDEDEPAQIERYLLYTRGLRLRSPHIEKR